MRLATRSFFAAVGLVLAIVVGLALVVTRSARLQAEWAAADALQQRARLVAALLPSDSAAWPEAARTLAGLAGVRVTVINDAGRVGGDSDFDRPTLERLQNQMSAPEVATARTTGAGRDIRSGHTGQRELYVAVRTTPPTNAVVRLATSLRSVEDAIAAIQWAMARAGALALVLAALGAWVVSRGVARPLAGLTDAARAIASGRQPDFPESGIQELGDHALALRAMDDELSQRFTALRREREETHTLIESMSDGVIAASARGDIASCNTAARRLLGYRDDAALPPLAQLFHDKPARDLLRDALAGREVEQRALDLEDRVLLVTARALPDGGTLLVLRDVTELRRLEAVRRDFVANVSHELKTPLTSIAGYAETLAAESRDDAQTAKFAATILSNAHRMQRLVDELLDLSRIESGGWRPLRRVIELDPIARDAWTPFADRAAAHQVTFDVAVGPDAHALAADPEALRQVFTNLFENALRHTPAGGRIRVAADVVADSVRLSVEDTGSGIPSDHLPRIFERFYRVDAGRAREQGGTGLGLAIVKHLVEAHGGHVDAESTLGRGTTIHMTFPVHGAA